jgi:inosose dehydratase
VPLRGPSGAEEGTITHENQPKEALMHTKVPRRDFLTGIAALTAASAIPVELLRGRELLYPPRDLSYFDTPITPAPSDIHWGYASITWNGNDRQAADDIAALGFRGIQLRSNCIQEFGSAAAVRDLLDKHQLKLVALSSGDLNIDSPEAQELAKHAEHAKFVHDAGGLYLQVTSSRPKGRAVTSADHKRFGQLLTELGKRTADLGVPLGFHNHMNSLGERPDEVDQIMDAANPRYAKLELDVAHYFQGGGDPAKAIAKFSDRLLFLHIKDVERRAAAASSRDYRFVELGRGLVNLPAAFDALHKTNFRGWAIIELDAVPDKARTPKESAAISKKYAEEKLGAAV